MWAAAAPKDRAEEAKFLSQIYQAELSLRVERCANTASLTATAGKENVFSILLEVRRRTTFMMCRNYRGFVCRRTSAIF